MVLIKKHGLFIFGAIFDNILIILSVQIYVYKRTTALISFCQFNMFLIVFRLLDSLGFSKFNTQLFHAQRKRNIALFCNIFAGT